jgi:hypothetical protein
MGCTRGGTATVESVRDVGVPIVTVHRKRPAQGLDGEQACCEPLLTASDAVAAP